MTGPNTYSIWDADRRAKLLDCGDLGAAVSVLREHGVTSRGVRLSWLNRAADSELALDVGGFTIMVNERGAPQR